MSKFSIKAVFEGVNKVSKPVKKMQNSVRKFTVSAENGMRKVDNAIGGVANSFGKGAVSAAKWGTGIALAGAVGIGMLNQQQQEVENLTNAVGGNIQTVEAVSSAVSGIGLGTDNVIDLMEEMNNKLGESKGLEEITAVSESLAILGLRYTDIKKLSPEEQFKKITNATLKMEDATKAQAAADILMGGEANKIIGTLRQQGGSIEEIIANYEKLSFRTEKSRQGARDMAKSQSILGKISKSLGQEISGLAGKHLAPLIEKFNEFLITNKEVIGQSIDKFFTQMADSVGDVSTMFDRALGFLMNLHANFESVKEWTVIIAKVTAGVLALMVGLKLFIGVMTAVNLVMAANPAVLIILGITAAVAALVAAGYAIYSNWDSISKFLLNVWEQIKTAFGWTPLGVIMQNWDGIKDYFAGLFSGIAEMYDATVGAAMRGIEAAKGFFGMGDDESKVSPVQQPQQISRRNEMLNRQFRERHAENQKLAVMSPQEKQAYFNQQYQMQGTVDVNVHGSGGVTPEQPTYTTQLKLATSGN